MTQPTEEAARIVAKKQALIAMTRRALAAEAKLGGAHHD